MNKIINDPVILQDMAQRVQLATPDSYHLSPEWVTKSGLRVLGEFNGGQDAARDRRSRLSATCKQFGIGHLIGVSNDHALTKTSKFVRADNFTSALLISADEAGLYEFDEHYYGLNTVLLPESGLAFIFVLTVDDFTLVAGSVEFLRSYFGDVIQAQKFFVEEVVPPAGPRQVRTLAADSESLMSWVHDST